MRRPLRGICLATLALTLLPMGVLAQSAGRLGSPDRVTLPGPTTFGISDLTSYTIVASEFSTYSPLDTWAPIPGTPGRYLTGGPPDGVQFVAAVHLPQGASVELIEAEGCDNSPTGNINGSFVTAASPAGGGFPIAGFNTGNPETPGCAIFQVPVSPPVTIDNKNNVYYFGVENEPFDGSTYFQALRVYYRLQVSPAPPTATFGDVPVSDPGFQFIEAFAAAGITAGCGNNNFCPDDPPTRRQMAIFFAKALGLHWPN